jgi:hypothetical protein
MLQLLLRRNDDNMETFHIETCDNKSFLETTQPINIVDKLLIS